MFLKKKINTSIKSSLDELKQTVLNADTIVIGAGSGLSTSAGYTYAGQRFMKYFEDFIQKYRFRDMYSGGFYPFESLEEHWAYWSRYIYINRYMDPPKPVYKTLYDLVKDKDYFVLTTNVDHCFQKAGFDKKRLFYTQGDYGLFQCSEPCHQETYDNKDVIEKMVQAQGFVIEEDGTLVLPEGVVPKMEIPSELIPTCPHCGKPMTMNLRADDTFVEDEGWHQASERYYSFVQSRNAGPIVFLELGVGGNTPVIIKYPFWRMSAQNPEATYICLNKMEAFAPDEIKKRSICLNADIGDTLEYMQTFSI